MRLYPDAPYDYAAVAGGLVFTAGACPLDESGRVAEPGDLEAQAARTVDNLLAALADAGAGPGDIVKATIYVVARERSELVRVWKAVVPHLGRVPNTLLGVSLLGYEGQLVEIEAIAHVKS